MLVEVSVDMANDNLQVARASCFAAALYPLSKRHDKFLLAEIRKIPLAIYKTSRLSWGLCLAVSAIALHAQTSPSSLPTGIWQASGYGYIFDVQSDRIREFDLLADHCSQTDARSPLQFGADWGDWESLSSAKVETWRLKVSGMEVTRLDHLPNACALFASHDARPLANFDYFWNTFHVHYPFFLAHGVDWDAVRSELRPKAAALPDNGDLYPILADMVSRLKDSHTFISDGQRSTHIRKFPYPEEIGPNGPYLLDDHYMIGGLRAYMRGPNSPLLAPAQTAGNGQVLYGRLKIHESTSAPDQSSDIGYIALFGMKQFSADETRDTRVDVSVQSARQAMREVVSSLRGVKGLVIDLRYNGGGEDAVALAISGFFTDQPVAAYSKRAFFNGKLTSPYTVSVIPEAGDRLAVPIVFLTSDMTVSAAEVCALDLKAMPNSVQLGQPTRGSLSDRLEKKLPNGWSFSLSNEIYTDIHSRVFEVTGITPDILTTWPSPKAPDDIRFGRDIATAVARLQEVK